MWWDVVAAHERMENSVVSLRGTGRSNSRLGFDDDGLPASHVGWPFGWFHPIHLSTHHPRRCILSYCEAYALIMTSALFLAVWRAAKSQSARRCLNNIKLHGNLERRTHKHSICAPSPFWLYCEWVIAARNSSSLRPFVGIASLE